ncbi:uncharacterized protein UMAG_03393 [Mycosarcoma maydis]|uniref:Uncharacterized protein n=1 Tax=Mycosarcoma maydis TaxID=5270 RepID=A0A0D1DVJ0_MYCMD|nr:uncharacterized protein UMAG_03393 [Ustilago maydis 521]KIS68294.1 hypothetical protein UMAG_03393 [Ustilago maydis 521]|eukprot:XP_011389869.1 hypothetical protein UMAG_03393 [Ustilago maydis 521]
MYMQCHLDGCIDAIHVFAFSILADLGWARTLHPVLELRRDAPDFNVCYGKRDADFNAQGEYLVPGSAALRAQASRCSQTGSANSVGVSANVAATQICMRVSRFLTAWIDATSSVKSSVKIGSNSSKFLSNDGFTAFS